MPPAHLKHLRPFAIVAFLLLPVIGATTAGAQDNGAESGPIAPVQLELAFGDLVDAGSQWHDGDTLHVRDLSMAMGVAGNITGTATLHADLDSAGSCEITTLSCDGRLHLFGTMEITTDDASWSGSLALDAAPGAQPAIRAILIGHQAAAGKVLVIDEVTEVATDPLVVSGTVATLDAPVGGIHLSHSACLTGEYTADGGFLGERGLIIDNGPARIHRHDVGLGAPLGVYGELTDIGHKGIVRAEFVAGRSGPHAHGSFVLAGESGAYRGIVGYGRALMSLSEDARCRSGLLATSTWIGQARYVTDPGSFLAPRVSFRTPVDGATIPAPVDVELSAEHVEIEPAGGARDGAGYLVVIIDAPCVGPGEPVPEDDAHVHLKEGETATRLNLFSGKHRLCLQLVNGAGVAQPATDVITITVASSGGNDNL